MLRGCSRTLKPLILHPGGAELTAQTGPPNASGGYFYFVIGKPTHMQRQFLWMVGGIEIYYYLKAPQKCENG